MEELVTLTECPAMTGLAATENPFAALRKLLTESEEPARQEPCAETAPLTTAAARIDALDPAAKFEETDKESRKTPFEQLEHVPCM
jgi:hypothetical protein